MKCSNCNQVDILQDAIYCPYCGKSLLVHYEDETLNFSINGVEFEFVKIHSMHYQSKFGYFAAIQYADMYVLKNPVSYAQWRAVMGKDSIQGYKDPISKVDIFEFSDDEVVAYDFIFRFGNDMSDDEIDGEIARLKQNPVLFKKMVHCLRSDYSRRYEDTLTEQDAITNVTYDECQLFCDTLNELSLNLPQEGVFGIPSYEELVFAHHSELIDNSNNIYSEWTNSSGHTACDLNEGLPFYNDDEVIAYDYIDRWGEHFTDEQIDEEIDNLKEDKDVYLKRVALLRNYYREKQQHRILSNVDQEVIQVFNVNKVEEIATVPKNTTDSHLGFRLSFGPALVCSPAMFENLDEE